MPSAIDFFEKFTRSYREKRAACQDDWDNIWTDTNKWSCFMIYDADSVIRRIALNDLTCFPKEPMHIDAIFTSTERWDWFPIEIAIEHENNPRSFHGEINKLISIASPLKVGITYAIEENSIDSVKNKIQDDLINSFKKRRCICNEEEYLFIIGVEDIAKKREIKWHYAIVKPESGRIKNLAWA